jgi:GDPmannose 4,6-dehydratase
VSYSFNQPIIPLEVNAVAAARLLEAARLAIPDVRFFQPSTSEMFGKVSSSPQNESTPFRPRSPYAVAKLFSHWQTVIYREAYKFFGACGILFNHESPLRGRQFVTRKITAELVQIKHGRREKMSLGDLDVRRDWGFAGDYVEGMWRALQQQEPDDYVFATGISNSVRTFVELTAECLGIALEWSGSQLAEVGIDRETGRTVIDINPAFFRPAEVRETVGDARHAHDKLGWSAVTSLRALVAMMAAADERRLLDGRPLD